MIDDQAVKALWDYVNYDCPWTIPHSPCVILEGGTVAPWGQYHTMPGSLQGIYGNIRKPGPWDRPVPHIPSVS